MNYTIDNPSRTSGEKIQNKLTEKVKVQIEGFESEVIYEDLAIDQEVLDHQYFGFLWKFGENLRMSYQDQASVIRDYLGKDVAITLKDPSTGLQVNFKGIITEMQINDDNGVSEGFTVIGKSTSVLLDDVPQSQTYTQQNLKDIITKVASEAPEGLMSGSAINPVYPATLPYAVQYNETDFQFLQRIAMRYGEWFFYDGEQLVFGDTLQYDAKLVNGLNLHNFSISSRIVPQKAAFKGYVYRQSGTIEKEQAPYQNNTKSQFAQDAVQTAEGLYQRNNPNTPFIAHANDTQELERMQQLYQQAQEARTITYSGISKIPLKIGGLVSIAKDGVESMFLVTRTVHTSDVLGHYECSFESIPYDVKVPHYTDPFIVKTGEPQSAKVVDNNDPEGMGRVIVEFYWGHKTDWIRMIQPHAGSGKGFHFIPEIDEEVLVGFEGNNVDKPYVIGAKYNSEQQTAHGTANNDLKVIQTRSGTKIKMDDAAGSILIEDPSGSIWFMDGQGNIQVDAPKNITLNAGENITISAGKSITESAGKDIVQSATGNITESADNKMELIDNNHNSHAQEVNASAGQITTMSTDENMTLQSAKTVSINSGEKGNLF